MVSVEEAVCTSEPTVYWEQLRDLLITRPSVWRHWYGKCREHVRPPQLRYLNGLRQKYKVNFPSGGFVIGWDQAQPWPTLAHLPPIFFENSSVLTWSNCLLNDSHFTRISKNQMNVHIQISPKYFFFRVDVKSKNYYFRQKVVLNKNFTTDLLITVTLKYFIHHKCFIRAIS